LASNAAVAAASGTSCPAIAAAAEDRTRAAGPSGAAVPSRGTACAVATCPTGSAIASAARERAGRGAVATSTTVARQGVGAAGVAAVSAGATTAGLPVRPAKQAAARAGSTVAAVPGLGAGTNGNPASATGAAVVAPTPENAGGRFERKPCARGLGEPVQSVLGRVPTERIRRTKETGQRTGVTTVASRTGDATGSIAGTARSAGTAGPDLTTGESAA
jgi:hypothetical protein